MAEGTAKETGIERQAARGHAPSKVRAEVLTQHEGLRTVLSAAQSAARNASPDPPQLRHLAHEIRRRFRAHLAFEERVLIPVLAAIDVWGPDRVRDLIGEHTRQRADLEALVEAIDKGGDGVTAAAVLRGLAIGLLRDMAEEERDYLGPELLRDHLIFVDRG
jgi:hypothetical protein